MFSRNNKRSGTWLPPLRHVDVLGSHMAYREEGSGPPVVFLHGGIGSSAIWRRQMAIMAEHARCVAVDLIGTGHSGRLLPSFPGTYRTEVHLSYLEAFLKVIRIESPVVLVVHGWASMAGLALAQRQADRLRGVAYLEAVTEPLSWVDLDEPLRRVLERARSEDGERFVMDTDEYFDLAVRREAVTPMGRATVDLYRKTLGDLPEMRRALHTGLTEIPIDGDPASSHSIVKDFSAWLDSTDVPKLLVSGTPGYLIKPSESEVVDDRPNQTVVRVAGAHLLQEDSPDGVGLLLDQWHRSI